jgi:hypothetical protein
MSTGSEADAVPSRVVVQADALAWMQENSAPAGASVVTSLPDVSELGGVPLDAWRVWFEDAARAVLRWVPEGGVAIFFQSDIRHGGVWIDKGHLVHRGADAEGAKLLWRATVCRKPAGTISAGRPGTSHMMCVARPGASPAELGALGPSSLGMRGLPPDVLPDAGFMPWSRAMGANACRAACRYLLAIGRTTLVDPFCGYGTALAVANAMGLDSIGVDLSAKACRAARRCVLPEGWDRAPSDALSASRPPARSPA